MVRGCPDSPDFISFFGRVVGPIYRRIKAHANYFSRSLVNAFTGMINFELEIQFVTNHKFTVRVTLILIVLSCKSLHLFLSLQM